MSKYYRLITALEDRTDKEWTAKFSEIEDIIGNKLPMSASTYQAWWANRPQAQGRIWLRAGWRVTKVDLEDKQVTFIRFADPSDTADGSRYTATKARAKALGSLTVAEAKAGLAMNFGVPITKIKIVVHL